MTILLTDKKVATILEPRHMLELVDKYMGMDARMWFEDYLTEDDSQTADVVAMETYYEKRIEHYQQVSRELRAHAEKLAGLIREKELNRTAISHEPGQIGVITGRKLR